MATATPVAPVIDVDVGTAGRPSVGRSEVESACDGWFMSVVDIEFCADLADTIASKAIDSTHGCFASSLMSSLWSSTASDSISGCSDLIRSPCCWSASRIVPR